MAIKRRILKRNDRVGLISPGARPASPATVSYAVRVVEEMGLVPIIGKHALNYSGHFAGTDDERLEDVNTFLRDQSISAIFCLTGGFGALPLLPRLDFEAAAKSEKLIVGSDENTVLLLALQQKASLPAVLGPNLDRVKSKTSYQGLLDLLFNDKPTFIRCKQENLGDDINVSRMYTAFTGGIGTQGMDGNFTTVPSIAGKEIIGGNLSAVLSLMGTPFQPDFSDKLLYLDDYNERYDILDRWFTTLWVSQQLEKTAGVVFGEFAGCASRGNVNILPVEDLFGERLASLRKPHMFGLPIGHSDQSHSIPLGIKATFNTRSATLEFEQ